MTLEDYEALLERQGHACAICERPYDYLRPLHVDHDHGTSHVRGLLCAGCNTGLGKLGDSVPTLWLSLIHISEPTRPY